MTVRYVIYLRIDTKTKNEQSDICVFWNFRYGVQISVSVRHNCPVSFGDEHEEPFNQSAPRMAI